MPKYKICDGCHENLIKEDEWRCVKCISTETKGDENDRRKNKRRKKG